MRDHLRDAAISAGVGVLVAYLVTIDSTHPGPKWSVVRYGALLGVFAYVFCSGLTHLFRRWLDRLPVPGWLSRAALYFVGVCLRNRADPRARRYFRDALRANPLHFKSAVRLLMG